MTSSASTLYGNYQILKSIASGGMGEIFLAKRIGPEGFEKLLVLKKMLPHLMRDTKSTGMFLNEAKLAAQLNHTNIVQIYDFGREEDSYYIAMEYIHGKNLKDIIERSKQRGTIIPFQNTIFIMNSVLTALDFAHKKKGYDGRPLDLIHRDVSPQNVLISYEGEVKLTDFGIAKASLSSMETTLGTIKGKLSYMSPEQVMGEPLCRRSDIFSLGVVFFEMLTGTKLFPEETSLTNVVDRIRKADIPIPRDINPKIPEVLENILLKSLARTKQDRFQDAREMQDAIAEFVRAEGFRSSSIDLATYMRSLFPEEELSSILSSDETMLAQSPVKGASFEDKGSSERATFKSKKTAKRLLIASTSVLFVVIISVSVFLALKPGNTEKAPKSETSTITPPPAAQAPQSQTAATEAPSIIQTPDAAAAKEIEEGRISITSVPSGASIMIDEEKISKPTPVRLSLAYGEHLVRLQKKGYESYEETVEITEDARDLLLKKELTPLPAGVNISADPPDSVITFNGSPHNSPFRAEGIGPGQYQVSISRDGYKTKHDYVNVRPGESKKSHYTLQKAEERGWLKIDSMPYADVYLDGTKIGTIPIDKYEVSAGPHKLRFVNDMGLDESITVELKQGETRMVRPEFFGWLDVSEEGAKISVDGKEQKGNRFKLTAIVHEVKITWPNGKEENRQVRIQNGKTISIP